MKSLQPGQLRLGFLGHGMSLHMTNSWHHQMIAWEPPRQGCVCICYLQMQSLIGSKKLL